MNYQETLSYIHSLGNFSKPAGLERIKAVLEKLGNPQKKFPSVHIAGTNGKGSVSCMLSYIFREAGLKTALFISPYIIDFRERIQINGEFISENDLIDVCAEVKNTKIELTEFEFITAAAFLYFSKQKCDIAVVETGLGGRLDATNTLTDVRSAVITKIGLDHTAILGDTYGKIAREKCGIIKNCPVITNPCQPKEAMNVIKDTAKRLIVPDINKLSGVECSIPKSTFIYKEKKYELSLLGEYQVENALCAIECAENIGFEIPYETVFFALKKARFPARAEIISEVPLVVLDGAHNPDGAEALAGIMKNTNSNITAVIGVMRDKDYKEILRRTLPLCKNAIAVKVEGLERSLSAEELCKSASEYCPCAAASNLDDALKKAKIFSDGGAVFVFGSLYLASALRQKLKEFYK